MSEKIILQTSRKLRGLQLIIPQCKTENMRQEHFKLVNINFYFSEVREQKRNCKDLKCAILSWNKTG